MPSTVSGACASTVCKNAAEQTALYQTSSQVLLMSLTGFASAAAVGGDHSPLATARSLPIRRVSSSPMAMHRSGLHPQVSGSLTGSYARPMNSHL